MGVFYTFSRHEVGSDFPDFASCFGPKASDFRRSSPNWRWFRFGLARRKYWRFKPNRRNWRFKPNWRYWRFKPNRRNWRFEPNRRNWRFKPNRRNWRFKPNWRP